MSCLANLKFIFMPSYWGMNEPFSEVWDVELRSLMSKHKFRRVNKYTATLGDTEVWVCSGNYPCSYMMPHRSKVLGDVRPSRETIYKAHKKYLADLKEGALGAFTADPPRLIMLEAAVQKLSDAVETNHKAVLKAIFAVKEKKVRKVR